MSFFFTENATPHDGTWEAHKNRTRLLYNSNARFTTDIVSTVTSYVREFAQSNTHLTGDIQDNGVNVRTLSRVGRVVIDDFVQKNRVDKILWFINEIQNTENDVLFCGENDELVALLLEITSFDEDRITMIICWYLVACEQQMDIWTAPQPHPVLEYPPGPEQDGGAEVPDIAYVRVAGIVREAEERVAQTLRQELNQQRTRLTEIELERNTARDERDRLDRLLGESRTDNGHLRKVERQLTKKVEEAGVELRIANERFERVNGQRQDAERRLGSANGEMSRLTTELEKAQEAKGRLTNRLAESTAEIRELTTKVEVAEKRISQVEEALNQEKAVNAAAQTAGAAGNNPELAASNERVRRLTEELDRVRAEANLANETLAQAERERRLESDEFQRIEEHVGTLTANLERMQEQVTFVKGELGRATHRLREAEARVREMEAQAGELQSANALLETRARTISARDKRISELTQLVEQLQTTTASTSGGSDSSGAQAARTSEVSVGKRARQGPHEAFIEIKDILNELRDSRVVLHESNETSRKWTQPDNWDGTSKSCFEISVSRIKEVEKSLTLHGNVKRRGLKRLSALFDQIEFPDDSDERRLQASIQEFIKNEQESFDSMEEMFLIEYERIYDYHRRSELTSSTPDAAASTISDTSIKLLEITEILKLELDRQKVWNLTLTDVIFHQKIQFMNSGDTLKTCADAFNGSNIRQCFSMSMNHASRTMDLSLCKVNNCFVMFFVLDTVYDFMANAQDSENGCHKMLSQSIKNDSYLINLVQIIGTIPSDGIPSDWHTGGNAVSPVFEALYEELFQFQDLFSEENKQIFNSSPGLSFFVYLLCIETSNKPIKQFEVGTFINIFQQLNSTPEVFNFSPSLKTFKNNLAICEAFNACLMDKQFKVNDGISLIRRFNSS